MHSSPRHKMEVTGQLYGLRFAPWEKPFTHLMGQAGWAPEPL
jgi:hypothetical protein